MTIGILTIFSLYTMVILISEFFYRKGVSSRATRKFAHIGAGIVSALLPVFVSLSTAVVIGILFFALFFYSKKKNFFPSIYGGRNDHGAAYFPLGLVVCALLFWNINPTIFSSAIFLFAVADGLAGLIGEKYGKTEYNFMGKKTVEGSIVFFLVSLAILSIATAIVHVDTDTMGLPTFMFVPLSALLLSFAEGVLGKGLDNLVLPSLAGSIFAILL